MYVVGLQQNPPVFGLAAFPRSDFAAQPSTTPGAAIVFAGDDRGGKRLNNTQKDTWGASFASASTSGGGFKRDNSRGGKVRENRMLANYTTPPSSAPKVMDKTSLLRARATQDEMDSMDKPPEANQFILFGDERKLPHVICDPVNTSYQNSTVVTRYASKGSAHTVRLREEHRAWDTNFVTGDTDFRGNPVLPGWRLNNMNQDNEPFTRPHDIMGGLAHDVENLTLSGAPDVMTVTSGSRVSNVYGARGAMAPPPRSLPQNTRLAMVSNLHGGLLNRHANDISSLLLRVEKLTDTVEVLQHALSSATAEPSYMRLFGLQKPLMKDDIRPKSRAKRPLPILDIREFGFSDGMVTSEYKKFKSQPLDMQGNPAFVTYFGPSRDAATSSTNNAQPQASTQQHQGGGLLGMGMQVMNLGGQGSQPTSIIAPPTFTPPQSSIGVGQGIPTNTQDVVSLGVFANPPTPPAFMNSVTPPTFAPTTAVTANTTASFAPVYNGGASAVEDDLVYGLGGDAVADSTENSQGTGKQKQAGALKRRPTYARNRRDAGN